MHKTRKLYFILLLTLILLTGCQYTPNGMGGAETAGGESGTAETAGGESGTAETARGESGTTGPDREEDAYNGLPQEVIGEMACIMAGDLPEDDYDIKKVTDDTGFSEYQTLVINGFLLGGYYNHRWIGCEELYPMLEGKDQYKIYIDGRYRSTAAGYKDWSEPEDDVRMSCGPTVDVQDIYHGDSRDYNIIAFSGGRDLEIEAGKEISPDNEIYQKLLKDYLDESGFTEPFELTKVLKIDVDDDGQDEIFMQAYDFVDPIEKSTGIQFMRKIADNEIKVYSIPVTSPTIAADYITIIGFCDLNGDGLKEVLMSSSGIGYSGYLVYEFKDNQFSRIYENGTEH